MENTETETTDKLEFVPAKLSDGYKKRWNIYKSNIYYLYLNGQKISDTLYSKGMFFDSTKKYRILHKHTEDYYPDSVTLDVNAKPHLKSWECIINTKGEEKYVNQDQLHSIYLQGGIIFCCNKGYFNIETGYFYGYSQYMLDSKDFIFISVKGDNYEDKGCVLKINKSTGEFESFKK